MSRFCYIIKKLFRYLIRKLKPFLAYDLNFNYVPALLFKTMQRHGLKLENDGPTFSSLNVMPEKIKKSYYD